MGTLCRLHGIIHEMHSSWHISDTSPTKYHSDHYYDHSGSSHSLSYTHRSCACDLIEGFNREWEKGIYFSSHTTANLKSKYTFSSPKDPSQPWPTRYFLFVFSPRRPQIHDFFSPSRITSCTPNLHTQFHPGTQQSQALHHSSELYGTACPH